ncbi:MAG: hypothetical protein COB54_05785 [Alphaproteobacteria bacterium]|nr:MAG: hypothetical protein COB54_05785 [Alphaproteobacteria bacterium]
MPHFFRLIYGPLILWVLVKVTEQVLNREYDIAFNGKNILHLFTAGFAIVWYRQFLLGSDYASYRLMIKKGFTGKQFTLKRFGRAVIRITVITLALLVPAMIISIGIMLYYSSQGVIFTEDIIQQLATKTTFIVMLLFSPIMVRLSLYTAGFALGRTSLGFRQVWTQTRGYTATLWWMTIRGFLPLTIYSYILTWFLHRIMQEMAVHYILSTVLIESLTAFLTFMMLAIVVAANAEAFRILIGTRDGDTPHRDDSGPARE